MSPAINFFLPCAAKCSGFLGLLVDNNVLCCEKKFPRLTNPTAKRAETNITAFFQFGFAGVRAREMDLSIVENQFSYAKFLEEL